MITVFCQRGDPVLLKNYNRALQQSLLPESLFEIKLDLKPKVKFLLRQ